MKKTINRNHNDRRKLKMPIFNKKSKTSKSREMKPYSAPPSYEATILTPSAPRMSSNDGFKPEAFMVDLCFTVISKVELSEIKQIYRMAQYILDEYSGPTRSKPIYMALFLASCHNMVNPKQVHGSWHYNIEYRGPINFHVSCGTPLNWRCSPVALSYECSIPERVMVSFTCSLRPTSMMGTNLESMFTGVIKHPNNSSVLQVFQVDEAEMVGDVIVFRFKDPGVKWNNAPN
ncbi:M protein [Eelpout rhabdovirus]|uniref:M protein n=1 Tax=Eelpout rhabdovirus TaxID=1736767 RepID=A0AAC8WAD1_9RHAB|nr:M protein [Eelpout rhabdovirus]ALJ30357.1 M protein [Eelpout rhabdovirus]